MEEELILRLGAFSTMLQASDEFKNLNLLFEQQIAVDVLNTKPTDAAERERLYATLQGARSFQIHIAGFANDYAIANTPEVVDQNLDDDNPDVHDISYESL